MFQSILRTWNLHISTRIYHYYEAKIYFLYDRVNTIFTKLHENPLTSGK